MANKFASKVNIVRQNNTHKDIQKKGAGGRPPVLDDNKRNKKVFLSLTEKEFDKLKTMADLEGVPTAVFVRKVLKENSII